MIFFLRKKSKASFFLAWILGDHPQSLNIFLWPIVNKYREGKVKRTLFKGVKKNPEIQYLQSIEAYKRDQNLFWLFCKVTVYLLHNGSASKLNQQA